MTAIKRLKARPGVSVVNDRLFDLLHPRARKGTPNAGQFVDVVDRITELGGEYHAPTKSWIVPKARRAEFDALLDEIGWASLEVPPGMRPADPGENAARMALGTREIMERIPPAWTDVFISDDPHADILVKARDSQGRVKAIYHRRFEHDAAKAKFAQVDHLEQFMEEIDQRLDREAATNDTAAALLLVRAFGMRPGSTKDTGGKVKVYGATTLQRRHVQVNGDEITFDFIGKGNHRIAFTQTNPRVARMLAPRLRGLNAEDPIFDTTAENLRDWLAEIAPDNIPYNFRTRVGTSLARDIVATLPVPTTPKEYARQRAMVGDQVAEMLGNTRTVALGSYVDPRVFEPWENADTMTDAMARDRVDVFDSVKDRLDEVRKYGLDDWPEKGDVANRVLGGAKDTQEMHTVERTDAQGRKFRAYTPQRQKVHDRIIGGALHQAVAARVGEDHPLAQKLKRGEALNAEDVEEFRRSSPGKPRALFMAGGPASGKSSALRNDPSLEPENAVTINPDDLKEVLPEYRQMVKGREKYAATGVHEESSDLGKRLQVEAMDLGLNIVIDGTGNSDPGKFAGRVAATSEAGYDVTALYVTIPTDEAVVRSTLRALREGRWVPTPELSKSHRRVSANFPDVAALGLDVVVVDNEGATPNRIFEIVNGKRVILDPVAYQRFLDKAKETD